MRMKFIKSGPESVSTYSAAMMLEALRKIDKVYVVVSMIFMGIALLDKQQLIPLSTMTLANLGHTSIYMAVAVLLLAGIKATGAEAIVSSIFKGREHRMIFLAALVGGLAPFCSCEVIPFIAGLLALGTPLPPIMAFWLSSPLIDPPTLLITAGALGWKFAISKSIFAVAIGIFGGYAVKFIMALGFLGNPQKALDENNNETCCSKESCTPDSCSDDCGTNNNQSPIWLFWKEKARLNHFFEEIKSNGLFLLKWMLFAYTLESLMVQYVPAHLIASVVGGEGLLPIILSALVGVPAYLNSYIAPPIVSGLMNQGMSVGSGMAFIIAGAITSIPAMTAVYALVRIRVFGLYVLLGFLGAVLSGFVYSFIG
jgi:uncharacterized membrane protein YraQ (UPF0718 family)